MTIGLMLLGMFALVLINVPVAVSLAVVAVAAIWIAQGPTMLPNVALVMFEGATNFPLLVQSHRRRPALPSSSRRRSR